MGVLRDASNVFLILAEVAQEHGHVKSEKIFTSLSYRADRMLKFGERVRLDQGIIGKISDVSDANMRLYIGDLDMDQLVKVMESADAALNSGKKIFDWDRDANRYQAQRVMGFVNEAMDRLRKKPI
jgi:ribosomal protein S8